MANLIDCDRPDWVWTRLAGHARRCAVCWAELGIEEWRYEVTEAGRDALREDPA